MNVKDRNTLLVEKAEGEIILRKVKTIFAYARSLPKLKLTIQQMRNKAIEETIKERLSTVFTYEKKGFSRIKGLEAKKR